MVLETTTLPLSHSPKSTLSQSFSIKYAHTRLNDALRTNFSITVDKKSVKGNILWYNLYKDWSDENMKNTQKIKKIGFIGIGNMGTPMILALAKAGRFKAGEIEFFDIDTEKVTQLAKSLKKEGFKPFATAEEMIKECDLVVLAVKPNVFKAVLAGSQGMFDKTILVSIVAGISCEMLEDAAGKGSKVVRAMPNTPCQIGEGVTLLSKGKRMGKEEFDEIIEIFKTFGVAEELPEKLMNEVIALTASSPAYVFVLIEAMADAAVQSGIPRATAYRLAAQAVQGSARLVLETGKQPGELKDAVCSPGGTTIEAVAKLEEKGFRSAVIEAMGACTDKARKLAKG